PITLPGSERPRGGLNPSQAKVMEEAIAALKAAGAVIVDPVEIPSVVATDPKENLLLAGQSSVLSYGMKRDFNKWLASLGPAAPATTAPATTAPATTAPTTTASTTTPPAPPLPFPPGFDAKPQPFGVGFTGPACSEPKLLQLAYAFEQATKKRTPPPGLR